MMKKRLTDENVCEICELANGSRCTNPEECVRYRLYELENELENRKQIEHEPGTSGKGFCVCDDIKLTNSEAQLNTKSEGCPNSGVAFSSVALTEEQLTTIREHLIQVGIRTRK